MSSRFWNNNYKGMASYYDKIMEGNKKGPAKHSKRIFSIDDSFAEDDDNKANVFDDSRVEQKNVKV